MESKLLLVTVIVNNGYSDKVMEVAKRNGARGGTIFNAAGSAGVDAEKLYGITVNPEKEVVFIIVNKDLSKKLLNAFYDEVGTDSEAQGIAFSLPITEATSNLTKQYTKTKQE